MPINLGHIRAPLDLTEWYQRCRQRGVSTNALNAWQENWNNNKVLSKNDLLLLGFDRAAEGNGKYPWYERP